MSYVCPVCEAPQADAEHLANHLAFTAMLHGDAHEQWLDDHVPGWDAAGVAELAPAVADRATEVADGERADEGGHDHGHARARDPARPSVGSRPGVDAASGSGSLDAEAQRALAEARKMTRAMLSGDGAGRHEREESTDPDADDKA